MWGAAHSKYRINREPMTILLATTMAVSAGSAIYSGQQQKKAADSQADSLRRQAEVTKQESEISAQRKEKDRTRFLAEQKMAYLANGIGLAGTPQAVFTETFEEFQQEIDAIRRSGTAQANYYEGEANTRKSQGRAALVSGYLGAGESLLSGYTYGKTTKNPNTGKTIF